MFLRFVIRAEEQQVAVGEQREAIAGDALVHLLLNQPVGHQHVLPALVVVENKQRILAVGRIHHALDGHSAFAALELFQLAGRQIIAVGKNQPVILRQQRAGLAERIDALRRLQLLVVDEVTAGGFLVGPDAQENQMADERVSDFRVIHFLEFVIHRLGVNAFAGLRVVLDLYRQVAAHALDEDAVFNRDVRMIAVAERLARGREPAEFILRRKTHAAEIRLRAPIEIAQLPALKRPLDHRDVVHARANLEDHVEVALNQRKFAERRAIIDLVEPLEVSEELLLLEDLQRAFLERAIRLVAMVDGENVFEINFLLQPELHVEAEQKPPAPELHHVARHAVVNGGDAIRLEEFELHVAENFLPPRVEQVHPLAQQRALCLQPLTDDLVRRTAERGRRARCRCGRRSRFSCGRVSHDDVISRRTVEGLGSATGIGMCRSPHPDPLPLGEGETDSALVFSVTLTD